MLFNSHVFIFLYLPVVVFGFYYIWKSSPRAGLPWLILSSLAFYAWWEYELLPLLIFSIVFNYYCSGVLVKLRDEAGYSKVILWFGISVNLAFLGYFKYYNFFIGNINEALNTTLSERNIILPLAISFYTFQQIAYLVDSYRNIIEEYKFTHYFLFVTFFPQLIAGPIVHHKDLVPQFAQLSKSAMSNKNIQIGLSIFVIGLFKKVVLADSLAQYADPVFLSASQGHDVSFISAWIGSAAYMLQIYFDFSGYSDMAVGLARIFGIKLPLNFNSPYKALSINEFWDRWHITLSHFIRDYIYIPLGGNRNGRLKQSYYLVFTMSIAGLWHGAGWTFVVWGLLHGFCLVINHAWSRVSKSFINSETADSTSLKVVYRLLVLTFLVFSWVLFRATDLDSAVIIMMAMLDLGSLAEGVLDTVTLENLKQTVTIGLLFLVVLYLPNTYDIFRDHEPAIGYSSSDIYQPDAFCWKSNLKFSIGFGLIGLIAILHMHRINEFIYYSF